MSSFKYINIFLLALILSACSADQMSEPVRIGSDCARIEGDKVIVTISIDKPDMPSTPTTRTLGVDPELHLYLIEFVDNGSPLRNTYLTTYEAENETPGDNGVVNYKVILNQTTQGRILHLVALPKSDNVEDKLNVEYGVEASVIPALKTENGTPGFWRRLSFEDGYVKASGIGASVEPSDDLKKLYHVALIRNYACITLTNEATNFELKGFAVINEPTAGSVAAWKASDYSFPELLDANQEMISYVDASSLYPGFVPSNTGLTNQEDATDGPSVGDDLSPRYIYERAFNSIRHTYVIIKGRRNGDANDTYYKLDLGKNDELGVFHYYNILRNYNYTVRLKSVQAKGYNTVQEAVLGIVYNNFSFDIELSRMLNMSDGNEVIYVNYSTVVLTDETQEQVLDFKYRFRDLTKNTPTYNNTPSLNGGDVNFINLQPGDVIKSVEIDNSDDDEGWRNVKITCHKAEQTTKYQSFTIVKSTGLGRTVNLVLHRKWTLMELHEFPGLLENWNSSTSDEGEVGDAIGSPFTIFFDVPDNLEESMFPLVFLLEADRQNMENDPLGALVVTSGPSSFVANENRIKYEKSVTWTQYNDPLTSDPYDNGTAIDNKDGTFTHRVRCRFRTTTDLANLPFDESLTKVKITNDNFNTAEVEFHREQ